MGFIYALRHLNEVYVGETSKTPEERFIGHKHSNIWVKALLAKAIQPEIITLEQCENCLNLELEKKWKKIMQAYGYNLIERVCRQNKNPKKRQKIKFTQEMIDNINEGVKFISIRVLLGDWLHISDKKYESFFKNTKRKEINEIIKNI